MAAQRPPIVLTSREYDRLEALLGALPAGGLPNKAALEAELRVGELHR